MTLDDPRQVLEIEAEAGEEEIRTAYLRKVKQYPPDRSPREFERVRDAYDLLRDPRRRMRGDAARCRSETAAGEPAGRAERQRQFTGPRPGWPSRGRKTL